jgi:hypothetical protein
MRKVVGSDWEWRASHCVAVGAVPVLSKEASSGERCRRFNQVKTPHNPLDSSAPLVKKGKQREVPKAKKPTSLKKVCGMFLWKQGTGKWIKFHRSILTSSRLLHL